MGMIDGLFGFLFGGGRNAVRETVEVFRENAEAGAERSANLQTQATAQLGQEFMIPRQGLFDRLIDGVNRLPRPALALGTLALFVSAMVDPVWFAARMQGVALVPEPLWWLLGVIVSFYFGARHQLKKQSFEREIARTAALAPEAFRQVGVLEALRGRDDPERPGAADTGSDATVTTAATVPEGNPALEDWRTLRKA
ncbi:holin family protein [Chachezhania antarctica]|uniref:holin family protein n=1 Tax=Chachezhania antarctica TaxID=2340860 RepID=UPI000EAC021C|nr:holin family protein [Chachezhania antarctica]|tara:strand:+ start:14584 stop:15174 length:591 start_codon:yes stop_codon:yes gene_type:complete